MPFWLLKTEPGSYSWDDLVRDGKTVWSGVANAAALIHLRKMKRGDRALIYHTGDERAAVGVAEVVSDPYPDPSAKNDRLVVVEVKPKTELRHAVTLDAIKSDPIFAGWDLLRISRLSVLPVPTPMWRRIEQLGKSPVRSR